MAGWLLPLMGVAIVGARRPSHKAKVSQKKTEVLIDLDAGWPARLGLTRSWISRICRTCPAKTSLDCAAGWRICGGLGKGKLATVLDVVRGCLNVSFDVRVVEAA